MRTRPASVPSSLPSQATRSRRNGWSGPRPGWRRSRCGYGVSPKPPSRSSSGNEPGAGRRPAGMTAMPEGVLGPLATLGGHPLPKPDDQVYWSPNALLILNRSAVLAVDDQGAVTLDDGWIRSWACKTRLGQGPEGQDHEQSL